MNEFCAMAAADIAAGVRGGTFSATEITRAALDEIAARDPQVNAFTTLLADQALAAAAALDARRAAGEELGRLAGVPFAVKNLFDINGVTTVAGSKIHREAAPATADATMVARLRAAGGVLLGALNMDEYAYGFTTENAHDGPTHNPHDLARIAGGSSGGSAAAVAAGFAAITLGSDTNGSIRVPASLCGVFGLKPTYGRLSRAGSMPFVGSLDHVGPFARSATDLALAYDAMLGADPQDPAQAPHVAQEATPVLHAPIDGLRIGILGGWFAETAGPEALAAVDEVARALGAFARVQLPEVARARAAAFCITASEGAALHLPDLRARPQDFDPATRARLLAGALLPATLVVQAQRLRRWFYDQVQEVFQRFDILLAPATPHPATLIGQATMRLGDTDVPVRANMGVYTQPISFIGLPVVAVPLHKPGALPIGVQIIARPWQEISALRVAACLEWMGIASAPVARGPVTATP